MWHKLKKYESCKYLREQGNLLYTIPDGLTLMYGDPDLDVIYYYKENDKPFLLIKKGFNDRGFWETTYHLWKD